MVPLTRLKGGAVHLNADLIASVEEHHDTVVTLLDGTRLIVAESAQQVVDSVIRFRSLVLARSQQLPFAPEPAPPAAPETGDALVLSLRPGSGT